MDTRVSLTAIWIGCLVGGVVGIMLAPALSAARPLAPPEIKVERIYTAQALNTGSRCIYIWDGQPYAWDRTDQAPDRRGTCPPVTEAQRRYAEAQHAPYPLVEPGH